MFTLLALSALLGSSLVRADVTPLTPSPGAVYNEGSTCNIAWTPDTTGAWNTTNIELMTGNNLNMIHLTSTSPLDESFIKNSLNFMKLWLLSMAYLPVPTPTPVLLYVIFPASRV